MPAPVKDQLPAVLPDHLHHQLTLSLGNPYGSLGQTCSDRLGSEVCAPFTFLRFKISKPSNRFAGYIDANVFRGPVRVAHKGGDASGVEDAIKIFPSGLRNLLALVDVERAGIKGSL
jgi:hypothetical protein